MIEDIEQKRAFAREWLKQPNNTLGAVIAVIGPSQNGDAAEALRHMYAWMKDPAVLQEKARLIEHGDELALLPNKAELAREVWLLGLNPDLKGMERVKAFELYANLRGYVEKPGITVNNTTVNKVMVVKDLGSNADWEARAQEQQRQLTATANAIRH